MLTEKLVVALGLLCGSALPAAAHDFWIEPSSFAPAPGTVIKIGLRVGEGFSGDPVRRESEKIEKFSLVGPAGETPIAGMEGADPAGLVRVESDGLLQIIYRSKRSGIELPAEKFETYLKEEGLEQIIALRAARGDKASPGREVYSRSAKAIVLAGDMRQIPRDSAGNTADDSNEESRVGLPLELVAETNPYALPPGAPLPIRVLFANQPLRGALVTLISRDEPHHRQSVRSDDAGRVTFTVPPRGAVLLKTVHMTPAPPGLEADWESHWASLTFEARVTRAAWPAPHAMHR